MGLAAARAGLGVPVGLCGLVWIGAGTGSFRLHQSIVRCLTPGVPVLVTIIIVVVVVLVVLFVLGRMRGGRGV
jgi:hypothetical protein